MFKEKVAAEISSITGLDKNQIMPYIKDNRNYDYFIDCRSIAVMMGNLPEYGITLSKQISKALKQNVN